MYLLVNLAIGGTWPGDAPTNFTSASLEIDYIRAYSLNGATTSSSAESADTVSTTYTAASSTDVPASTAVDTISSAYSYTLPTSFVHNLVLTGTAALTATGNSLGDHITGNGGNDTLIGGVGSDYLDASAGGNVLLNGGQGGVDTLVGGAGNDTFVVTNSSDVVTAVAGYQNVVDASVNFQAPANIVSAYLTGSTNLSLWANSTGDKLYANSGNDTLYGGAGNDSFVSGSGIDTFVAGTGVDTFWVQNAADVIQGVQAGSQDVVQTTVNYHLPDNAAKLVLTGSGNLTGWSNSTGATLVGNSGNDLLYGGAGNDSFVSGTGVDTMIGGAGADSYFVQNSADLITPGAGTSTVWADVSFHLPDNVQLGGLTGSASLSLWAGAGPVQLYANSGNDVLYAGAGADTLAGGAGNDTFVFGLNSGKDYINDFGQNGAHDVIDLSAALTAGYTASVTQAGGNAVITVSNGEIITVNNIQASTLIATGQGYAVNEVVTAYTANSATDLPTNTSINTVDSAYSYTLPSSFVNTLVLTGSGNLTATGNALGDHIVGNTGNDTLVGGGGNDVLDASKGGSDLLNGAAGGLDTFIAGAGADTFVVANSADVIQGVPNGAQDVVQSSVSFHLPDNVAELILTGTANIDAWSNTTGALLHGNAGNDHLYAGTGADTLTGGGGNDTFVFGLGSGKDVITDFGQNGAQDVIDLSAYFHAGATSSVVDVSGGAEISMSTGMTIELLGVHAAGLTLTSQGYMVNQAPLLEKIY